MNRPVDWSTITVPLDVSAIGAPPDYVRRWLSHERIDSGVVFQCQTATGRQMGFRVDVYAADVFRFRMNPEGLRPRPVEMLAETAWPLVSFAVDAQANCMTLTTDRVRLEWQRHPWQMRAYALGVSRPFFSERIDNRAYGPGYEVAPLGLAP